MPETEALAYMLSMLVMVLKRFYKDFHLVNSSVPYGVSKERGKKSRSGSTRTRRLRHRSRPVLVQDGALAATFGTFLFVSDALIARAFVFVKPLKLSLILVSLARAYTSGALE
jgi:hypothetical protein